MSYLPFIIKTNKNTFCIAMLNRLVILFVNKGTNKIITLKMLYFLNFCATFEKHQLNKNFALPENANFSIHCIICICRNFIYVMFLNVTFIEHEEAKYCSWRNRVHTIAYKTVKYSHTNMFKTCDF